MPRRKCARCGKTPPNGFASITIGDVTKWYCHPDAGIDCYSDASHEQTFGVDYWGNLQRRGAALGLYDSGVLDDGHGRIVTWKGSSSLPKADHE